MPTRSRSKTVPAKRASSPAVKAAKPAAVRATAKPAAKTVVKAATKTTSRSMTKTSPKGAAAAQRTRQSIRSAAARAVQQVLDSREAFALMMRQLEQKGWRIERAPGEGDTPLERGEL